MWGWAVLSNEYDVFECNYLYGAFNTEEEALEEAERAETLDRENGVYFTQYEVDYVDLEYYRNLY